MANGKKVLKRTLGGLKMAAAWAPIVLTIAGGAGFIGTLAGTITYAVKTDNFKETSIYQQEMQKDIDSYKAAVENGEMSEKEFVEAIEDMSESSYLQEVLNREIPGTEKYQGFLKNLNSFMIATFCSLGLAGAAGIAWATLGLTDKLDDLKYSARNDFRWEPPKPKNEEKPVEIKKDMKKDDISSDEENLGSLDDFLNTLQ